jgi:hypothetical protein
MSQFPLSLNDLVRPASPASSPGRARQLTQTVVRAALLAAGVLVLGSYALLAWAHARDRYAVSFTSGVYAGLAMHLNHGTFYPEPFDGSRYAGTRYMPLHFVLHAGPARLTGEYLVSGKLLTYALTLTLFAQLFCVLRRLGCAPPAALALLSLVVLSEPGLLACTTIRGDLLPVVLQLAALQIAAGGATWRRAVLAALLCTLALLTKLNAGWGVLAVGWFYLGRQRRAALTFGLAWAALTAGAVWLLDWCSDGRMLGNMRALSSSGLGSAAALLAPVLFLYRLTRAGAVLAVVVPLAAVECFQAFRQRRTSIYHLALPCCLLTTMPIYADMGVMTNHLIDLLVLAVPLLGCLWARLPEGDGARVGSRPVLALLLVWAMLLAWSTELLMPCLEVVRSLRDGSAAARYPARPFAQLIGPDEPILSADPWLNISRGQLPVVLDGYSIGRFATTRPELADGLARRICDREFPWLVLNYRLDDPCYLSRYHWEEMFFGPRVVQAMRDNYRYHSRGGDHFVYVPKTAALLQIEAEGRAAVDSRGEEAGDAQ